MLQDKLNTIVNKHKAAMMMKVADGKTMADYWHDFWNSDNKWGKLQEYGSKGLSWAKANPGKAALGGTALLALLTDPLGLRQSFSDNKGQSNSGGNNIANWIVPLLGGGLIYAGLNAAAGLRRTNDNVNNLITNTNNQVSELSAKVGDLATTANETMATVQKEVEGIGTKAREVADHTIGAKDTFGREANRRLNVDIGISQPSESLDKGIIGYDRVTGVNVTRDMYKKMTPEQKRQFVPIDYSKAYLPEHDGQVMDAFIEGLADGPKAVYNWVTKWFK